MALDPSIALAVRAPQFNVPIPQPLEQFGQILNLQNLMQQQRLFPLELQAKQLGLQQAQLAYQRDLAMADLVAHPEKYQTPALGAPAVTPAPAPSAAPLAAGNFVMGQGQGGTAIHSLDGGASWVNSTTGLPYSGPRYVETPAGTIGGGPVTPSAAPPLMGPAAVPYTPSLTTLQPILPPISTPAPMPAPIPAAAPAPLTPPVVTPPPAALAAAPAPAVPSGGIPGLPSWQQMLRAGGPAAFPWIKNINEAQKSQLEVEKDQLENVQLRNKEVTSILNGMVDNESKNRLLPGLGQKGYISWPEVRQYMDMDFNDPRFQTRKNSASQQALTYDQAVKLGFDRNEEGRKQNEEVRKWIEFHNKQFEQEHSDFKAQVGALTDPAQFGPLLSTKSDRLRAMYGGLVGQPLNDIKIWTGAGKPGETVPKATAVTQAEALAAGQRRAAEIAAEDLPYQGVANQVKTGQLRWDQVPDDQKLHVGRILSQQGSTPAFTKPLSDTESTTLTKMQTGKDAVTDLKNELSGARMFMTGPWSDIIREIPVLGAKWEGLQGKMAMLQATVGDLIKGGVLRAADQKIYEAMFPSITDGPWTVREKLGNLETKLTNDIGRYKENLRAQSKFIPGETLPAAPAGPGATPGPAKPPYQTIEKTGAPGARVTGSFTIGGATAAPPGKIVVNRPASLGGGQFYLDSNLWPEYQKRGFTRAD